MARKRRTTADDVADAAEGAGITRALGVLRELHRAPQTMPALAKSLGVHPRTVIRIVQAIERAGIEVSRTRERDARGRMGEVVYRVEGLGEWLATRKEG